MIIKISPLRASKFSVFKAPITNIHPSKTFTLLELATVIRREFASETIALRAVVSAKEKSSFKKSKFPAVTFSGTFRRRTDTALIKHSDLICVDVDGLDATELQRTKATVITDIDHTLLAFTSPSGAGLKVVYAMNLDFGNQKDWYSAWSTHLSSLCDLPISRLDSSCSNISRACFICNDPDCFINPKLLSNDPDTTIEIINPETPTPAPVSAANANPVAPNGNYLNGEAVRYSRPNFEHKDWEVNFKYLVSLVIKSNGEYGSPREPWIQKLASLCNQFGMQQEFTLEYILKHFKNHPESVKPDKPIDVKSYLIHPVKDVYERYSTQFDTWVNMAAEGEVETPLIEDAVYSNLPKVLQKACSFFTGRQRDVVLLGSIGVLSTCFPEVRGIYNRMAVCGNLFFFISAPASAGKGVLFFPRIIGEEFHKELIETYKTEMQAYEEELRILKESKSQDTPPPKPRLKKFFIPANSSTIKVIECLNDNTNFGLMFESEADTLFQALKNDWGNFSDTFRKVFHHEPVELQRKGDELYIRVQSPCMSAVLSGTPNQMDVLKNNAENGFLSRFVLYDFPLDPVWADVFDEGEFALEIRFQNISRDIHAHAKKIRQWCEYEISCFRPGQIRFQLTTEQKAKFNSFFEQIHSDMHHIYGKAPLSSVRRLGLITFRMAMIFSIVRLAETEHALSSELICKDIDLECTFSLVKTLLHHTIKIFNQMKKGGKTRSFKQNKVNYYEKLPDEFNRGKAMELARYLEIKEKTAENYLSQFIHEDILERIEHNCYRKL
jgi:hypothetical protein